MLNKKLVLTQFPTLIAACALFMLFSSSHAYAGWGDIDWESCGPNGITRRMKFMSDKKAFWASQHTDLEMILKTHLLTYDTDRYDCYLSSRNNQEKYATCLVRLDSKLRNINRCLEHSAQMCRINGGFC